ncbi:MAG: hypothetical protein IPO60_07710 [Flavobacteriales bacterium]|nr:hypothetical protein [Flavobacteriales bacterium]
MRAFLKTFALFMILPLAVFIATVYQADGRSDPYYLRFTTPPQGSLIVGDSRSAQGIQPRVLDSVLHTGGWQGKTFNYSFALNKSNFGPAYYKSIRKKLDPNSRDGVFVLSVDPWNISRSKTLTEEEDEQEEQERSFVARMWSVNMYPNVEYLLREYPYPFLTILALDAGQRSDELELHEDGWMEVSVDLSPKEVAKRIKDKTRSYEDRRLATDTLSTLRIAYLRKTVDLLKQHGTVLLVRLPVHSNIHAIEERYMPDFNRFMEHLAESKDVTYFVIPPDDGKWSFTDGNHMTPTSGAKVSRIIGEELLKDLRK